MLGEILRNLLRRKARTLLTMMGIVIGIFALTVMGAMSEYYNVILDNGVKISGANIDISPVNRDAENRLNVGTMSRLKRVDGVKLVMPSMYDFLAGMPTVSFGPPEMMVGVEPEHLQLHLVNVALKEGRWVERGDNYHAVVGYNAASKRKLKPGQTIQWREKDFTVVGILESTKTAPDEFVYAPLATVRKVMKLPSDTIGGLTVVPGNVAQAEELAARIREELPKVNAKSPKEAMDEMRQALATFQVIMISGALLAAVVGGLSVVNTMVMSVHERTREIGIKKAVGASTFNILTEYVGEATVLGIIGGIIGIGAGWLGAMLLNVGLARSMGMTELWIVTPRLVFTALFFATALGAVAGLYPAWRGARLEPIEALRSE